METARDCLGYRRGFVVNFINKGWHSVMTIHPILYRATCSNCAGDTHCTMCANVCGFAAVKGSVLRPDNDKLSTTLLATAGFI